MVNLKDDFRDWLIKQGLSEKTATGRHGTVYEYIRRIDKLCNLIYKGHNLKPWQQLAEDIYPIFGFHLLCRKSNVCVTQNNIAEIKDFLNIFLSYLRQYQDNLKNYPFICYTRFYRRKNEKTFAFCFCGRFVSAICKCSE